MNSKQHLIAIVIELGLILSIITGTLAIAHAINRQTNTFIEQNEYDNRIECHYQMLNYQHDQNETPTPDCIKAIQNALQGTMNRSNYQPTQEA